MGTAVLCLWAITATQASLKPLLRASASHFVSTVDLIKGEEQVLFAQQSYLGGFAEITLPNVLPRVSSGQGAGFSALLCSFPIFPRSHLRFIWIHQGHKELEKRDICDAGCPPTIIGAAPCQGPGEGGRKAKDTKMGGVFSPQGTRSGG